VPAIQPGPRAVLAVLSTAEIDMDPFLACAGSGCFINRAATAAKPSKPWLYMRTKRTAAALFDLIVVLQE
jgi:hypothetical protein